MTSMSSAQRATAQFTFSHSQGKMTSMSSAEVEMRHPAIDRQQAFLPTLPEGRVDMEVANAQGEANIAAQQQGKVAVEEQGGVVTFQLVENDGTPRNCERLVALKNIFAKQLPKMPKEYIVRLVFDRRHRSVALCKDDVILGGICYRPYFEQRFAEIAFCAVTATEQVKGYGTRLMNQCKEQAKSEGILYFLTYADNYAIGYFRKQGFSKTLGMPKQQWQGYIKDYDGAHLMECYIHPTVNHLDIPAMLARQREYIHSRIRQVSKSHIVHPGLDCFSKGKRVAHLMDIPGLREAGWDLSDLLPGVTRDTAREKVQLEDFLQTSLRTIKAHRASWPFQDPVDTSEVTDYLDIIPDPIDLSMIEQRLMEGDYYRTRNMLQADLLRMCRNCKTYNKPNTEYYLAAQELETYIRSLFKKPDLKGKGEE